MNRRKLTAVAVAVLMCLAIFTSTVSAKEQNVDVAFSITQRVSLEEINKEFSRMVEMDNNIPIAGAGANTENTMPVFAATNCLLPRIVLFEKEILDDGMAKYLIRIQMEHGKYDFIDSTIFVEENSEKKDLLTVSPGGSLKKGFYEKTARWLTENNDRAVSILDRREANVPIYETDFSFMGNWTNDTYTRDMYYGIVASKMLTMMVNCHATGHYSYDINVSAFGDSFGAEQVIEYEASAYDDRPWGNVTKIVVREMAIEFDPAHTDLIETQAKRYVNITERISNGTDHNDGMAGMISIAQLADCCPNETSPFNPGVTNIILFRMMATQTFLFDEYSFTPDFHYWTGDINGLYYVNETKVLETTINGGASPYFPLNLDKHVAGLMGGIEGYSIDHQKIDSEILYIGASKGGFGYYGIPWYIENNDDVTVLIWKTPGHAGSLPDCDPVLLSMISAWLG